jgi:hypothetical protein
LSSVGLISEKWILFYYNSAKNVPHFCKWGIGQITGGEHISRLVETLIEEVLPTAKLERRRYKK